ncbi:hypothetical protein GGR56DRAFT_431539 [Xylariaceae sp. FL0804]|nr:hypothetical protein GGR56DRAFT_431539 [Xylariaceae sp. FL0804]
MVSSGEAQVILGVVALVISIVALLATFLQILQQWFSSATGYAKCSVKVMGEWGRYTRRVAKPLELRYEVQFETPVIFLAAPTNQKGPVLGEKIWYVDGSPGSYEETRTLQPAAAKEQQDQRSAKQLIHTADNERASWVDLLMEIQKMEKDSNEWLRSLSDEEQHSPLYEPFPGSGTPAAFQERTLAVAIQRKKKSWDTMPSTVIKPYATTTMCHIVELAAILGLHWKEFKRDHEKYRAEGNGYILTGSPVSELGLVFNFQRTGLAAFEENRVIPKDEVKMLCFGVVPTIFSGPDDEKHLRYPLDDLSDPIALHLGSRAEIAATLRAIECNTNTINCVLQEDKKMSHLFPVSFEVLGMLGRTIHAKGSAFRMLPNPTIHHWNWDKKSSSMWKLLKAYGRQLKTAGGLRADDQIKKIEGRLEAIERKLEDVARARRDKTKTYVGSDFTVAVMDALHDALDAADEYLLDPHLARSAVLRVLRGHFQAVILNLNQATFNELDLATPAQRQDDFMRIYFDEVRRQALANAPPTRNSGFSSGSTAGESEPGPLTGFDGGDGGDGDERLDTIWCTLVFRMICWLLLHDFHRKDVQLSKSEMLGSRLPVYIV